METVAVGCKLPNGYTLEVGLSVTERGGPNPNGVITKLSRSENYRRFRLQGSHAHTAELRAKGMRMPSILNPQPFINQNVPKDLWDQWVKDHRRAWVLTSGQIFEVKDASKPENVKAAAMDAQSRPTILTPLDPSKPVKVGQDTVQTADFQPKPGQ